MTTVRILRADTGAVLVEFLNATVDDAMPGAIQAATKAPGVELMLEIDDGRHVDRTVLYPPERPR